MAPAADRRRGPLTEQAIRDFVTGWYRALDFHVPLAEAWSFLAESGLQMEFPDGKIRDQATFTTWYDRVTHLFFDESHYVQDVQCAIEGERATLRVVVGWQASFWTPPEARSRRTCLDATQRWTVRRSSKNAHGLEIETYDATLEPFKYAPGFARL
jgi:hypothetical protein